MSGNFQDDSLELEDSPRLGLLGFVQGLAGLSPGVPFQPLTSAPLLFHCQTEHGCTAQVWLDPSRPEETTGQNRLLVSLACQQGRLGSLGWEKGSTRFPECAAHPATQAGQQVTSSCLFPEAGAHADPTALFTHANIPQAMFVAEGTEKVHATLSG